MDPSDPIETLRERLVAAEKQLTTQSEALRASEARYRALFEHSPDLVFTVDFDGLIHGTNRTAQRRLAALENLPGRHLAEIFSPESANEVRGLFTQSSNGSFDRRFELADGRVVLLRAAPVPDLGPMLQVVLRDVTSRVRMEEELGRSKRLIAVGHLAAGVAHEINNPLTVMQLRIDLLREQHADPELRDQLKVIREHIHRVARIVQNLQTFARPAFAANHGVPIDGLLRSAIELAEVPLEGMHVDLILTPELSVVGDQGTLEQVFVNLLANAADAMDHKGRIEVHGSARGNNVHITVRDHGPGIPPSLLNDLFTPFTSGKPQRGTGLGLAIAWSLVHEHGGRLTAQNLAEGGACFSVELPIATEATPPLMPRATPDAPDRVSFRGDLLLLDDDQDVADVLADAASRMGYRVCTAHNAQSALALIEQRPFVGLLADVHLPGMSGTELLDHLKTHHPKLAEQTILMSGLFLDVPENVRYLQKPFNRHTLDATLRTLA